MANVLCAATRIGSVVIALLSFLGVIVVSVQSLRYAPDYLTIWNPFKRARYLNANVPPSHMFRGRILVLIFFACPLAVALLGKFVCR
jgi:hypothetical protein